jgi:hypothetical protein
MNGGGERRAESGAEWIVHRESCNSMARTRGGLANRARAQVLPLNGTAPREYGY